MKLDDIEEERYATRFGIDKESDSEDSHEDDSDDAGCSTTSDEVSSSGSFNHASSSGYNGFYSGLPLRRAL